MKFQDLPFENQQQIFSYLEIEDLAKIQLVCKSWRELVFHGDVWSHRELQYHQPLVENDDNAAMRKLCWVLFHAPCLNQLTIDIINWASKGTGVFRFNCLKNSPIKIRKLTYAGDSVCFEFLLFLRSQNELKSFTLQDSVSEPNPLCDSLAACVGDLLPQLQKLDISSSAILDSPRSTKLIWKYNLENFDRLKDFECLPDWTIDNRELGGLYSVLFERAPHLKSIKIAVYDQDLIPLLNKCTELEDLTLETNFKLHFRELGNILKVLRTLSIRYSPPHGFYECQELFDMNASKLTELSFSGVPCSEDGSWSLCRERLAKRFRETFPFLKIIIDEDHILNTDINQCQYCSYQ